MILAYFGESDAFEVELPLSQGMFPEGTRLKFRHRARWNFPETEIRPEMAFTVCMA
jgi:hypothetical protein